MSVPDHCGLGRIGARKSFRYWYRPAVRPRQGCTAAGRGFTSTALHPCEFQGQIRTVFNKVKSVFAEPDRPVVQIRRASIPGERRACRSDAEGLQPMKCALPARALGSLKARDRGCRARLHSGIASEVRNILNVRLEIVESLG